MEFQQMLLTNLGTGFETCDYSVHVDVLSWPDEVQTCAVIAVTAWITCMVTKWR